MKQRNQTTTDCLKGTYQTNYAPDPERKQERDDQRHEAPTLPQNDSEESRTILGMPVLLFLATVHGYV